MDLDRCPRVVLDPDVPTRVIARCTGSPMHYPEEHAFDYSNPDPLRCWHWSGVGCSDDVEKRRFGAVLVVTCANHQPPPG